MGSPAPPFRLHPTDNAVKLQDTVFKIPYTQVQKSINQFQSGSCLILLNLARCYKVPSEVTLHYSTCLVIAKIACQWYDEAATCTCSPASIKRSQQLFMGFMMVDDGWWFITQTSPILLRSRILFSRCFGLVWWSSSTGLLATKAAWFASNEVDLHHLVI